MPDTHAQKNANMYNTATHFTVMNSERKATSEQLETDETGRVIVLETLFTCICWMGDLLEV